MSGTDIKNAAQVQHESGQRLPERAAELMRRAGKKMHGRALIALGYDLDFESRRDDDPIVAVTGQKAEAARLYAPVVWLKKGGGDRP